MALSRLGARPGTERLQSLRRAAIGDDALDSRHRRADRGNLGLGLPAAANDAEAASAGPRKVLRGHTAGGPGAPLAECVGLDDGDRRSGLQVEEAHHERRLAGDSGIGLHSRVAQLTVDREHHGEGAFVERKSPPRHVLDGA